MNPDRGEYMDAIVRKYRREAALATRLVGWVCLLGLGNLAWLCWFAVKVWGKR